MPIGLSGEIPGCGHKNPTKILTTAAPLHSGLLGISSAGMPNLSGKTCGWELAAKFYQRGCGLIIKTPAAASRAGVG